MKPRAVSRRVSLFVVLLALFSVAGCIEGPPPSGTPDASIPDASIPDASTPDASTPDSSEPDEVAPVTLEVGVEGATLALSNGASLGIPPEALDTDVQLTMAVEEAAPPAEYLPASALFAFGPSGTRFARPVKVSLPLARDVTNPTIYWSKEDGVGYEPIGGVVKDGMLVAEVLHFSTGFVGEGTGTRTVSGVDVTTWVTETKVKNVPDDLSSRGVKALVLGADGGFTEYAGTGTAAGTFTIAGVPDGSFYLKNGTSYLVTDESVLDLGSPALGRPDTEAPPAGTSISFEVTNLAAWQDEDHLQFFSTNANSWYFDPHMPYGGLVSGAPAAGATALETMKVNSTGTLGHRLIDLSKGDRATLTQLSKTTSSTGVPYTSVSRVLTFEPFSQVAGQSLTLTGAMTEVSDSNSLALDWKITQFKQHMAISAPASTGTLAELYVMGVPGGLSRGWFSNTADFLIVSASTDADLDTGTMSYGTPLGGNWAEVVLARFSAANSYQLPGTVSAWTLYANMERALSVTDASAGPLVPLLTPVHSPQVNGESMMSGRSGIAVSPVVSWQAPQVGTPDLYRVVVHRLFASPGNQTRQSVVGSVLTRDTQVTIPPDLMVPGESYVLNITAITDPGQTPAAPFRSAFPTASTSVLSGIVQMAP